jgi:hypothetical protein
MACCGAEREGRGVSKRASERVGYLLHDFAAFFLEFFGVYALAVSRANAARHVGGYSVVERRTGRGRGRGRKAPAPSPSSPVVVATTTTSTHRDRPRLL